MHFYFLKLLKIQHIIGKESSDIFVFFILQKIGRIIAGNFDANHEKTFQNNIQQRFLTNAFNAILNLKVLIPGFNSYCVLE